LRDKIEANPMKILHISTFDTLGGAAKAAYRLHRGLLEIGEDSEVLVKRKTSTDDSIFCIGQTKSCEEFEDGDFSGRVIQEHYINLHRTEISDTIFSFAYPGYDVSVLPVVKTADIINLHWIARYQSPKTLHKLFRLGKPVIWTLHDQWAFTGGCHYTAGCEKYLQNCSGCLQLDDDPFDLPEAVLEDKVKLFRGGNLTVVTPSRWLAVCARKSRLFKNRRVEVIPYSLDTNIFSPLPKESTKKSKGIAVHCVTLLFGAERGDEKRKGFRELMASIQYCLENSQFQSLVKRGAIQMVCFGHPNDELGAMGIPTLSLGYIDSDEEIRQAYAAADIFILPSLEDNFPNTVLEAMSCGVPVVAFDAGGMPDVIKNGVTGQLVPACDHQAMGEAILSLIFNPEKRKEMGKNCREIMIEKYSITVQAQHYATLYRELYSKQSDRRMAQNSTVGGQQTEPRGAVEIADIGVCLQADLDSSVGPHFREISDQVSLKAFGEYSRLSEKKHEIMKRKLIDQEKELKQKSTLIQEYRSELEERSNQVKRLVAEKNGLESELMAVKKTLSWKITEPLRDAKDLVKKIKRY